MGYRSNVDHGVILMRLHVFDFLRYYNCPASATKVLEGEAKRGEQRMPTQMPRKPQQMPSLMYAVIHRPPFPSGH